jgi:hypothetical protein
MATVSMVVLGVVLHKQFRHFSIPIVASPVKVPLPEKIADALMHGIPGKLPAIRT